MGGVRAVLFSAARFPAWIERLAAFDAGQEGGGAQRGQQVPPHLDCSVVRQHCGALHRGVPSIWNCRGLLLDHHRNSTSRMFPPCSTAESCRDRSDRRKSARCEWRLLRSYLHVQRAMSQEWRKHPRGPSYVHQHYLSRGKDVPAPRQAVREGNIA